METGFFKKTRFYWFRQHSKEHVLEDMNLFLVLVEDNQKEFNTLIQIDKTPYLLLALFQCF